MRLATERVLEQEARAADLKLPMPAGDLATVLRELGVGLALAKLVDADAFPDRLHGDFVQLFFELLLRDQDATSRRRSGSSRSKPAKTS
jgi:hypothetical protein